MKTLWNNSEKGFIANHIAMYANAQINAAEKGAPLDKKELKKVIRIMDKFVPSAVYVPLKQHELLFVSMVISTVEHEFENRLIPEIEKQTTETKEADLARAKEVLVEIGLILKKLTDYMENKNVSSQ